MSDQDELIAAQKQVIGILFEVVKRLQANSDLDSEYLQIVSAGQADELQKKLSDIMSQRTENAKIVGRLLSHLED